VIRTEDWRALTERPYPLLGFWRIRFWRGTFQSLAKFADFLPIVQFGFALPVMPALIAVDFGHNDLLVSP
jgi:hypothetical protein